MLIAADRATGGGNEGQGPTLALALIIVQSGSSKGSAVRGADLERERAGWAFAHPCVET